jgi:transposase
MAPSPLFDFATAVDKDAVTIRLLVRVDELCARLARVEAENSVLRTRVAEIEAKLGLPPKAPNNSSTPPSQRKASGEKKKKSEGERRKAHAGAHRPLHPDPTSRRDVTAKACQRCDADVSQRPQTRGFWSEVQRVY